MISPDSQFTILGEEQTASLLTMDDALIAIAAAFAEHGRGVAHLSTPSAMFMAGDKTSQTIFKVKGGYMPQLDVCGFRIVGDVGFEGVGGEHHYCLLLDPANATPRALVAQKHIHRLRTAASGLLAAKALSPCEAPTMAIIGAGKIGAEMAHGFKLVFPKGRLLIASRRFESADALARTVVEKGVDCRASQSVEAAVEAADIILTITTAEQPLFRSALFQPGKTIIGMGEHHELQYDILELADAFLTDDIDFVCMLGSGAAWIRGGAINKDQLKARQSASLGAVIAGLHEGRRQPQDKVLAIVQGMVIGDLALANLCLQKAIDMNAGQTVRL